MHYLNGGVAVEMSIGLVKEDWCVNMAKGIIQLNFPLVQLYGWV